ncbi:C6 transcription factor [Xylariales sp. PMI_506]|nr:C6 transcription factor [Xylariales sp. PMI_506]
MSSVPPAQGEMRPQQPVLSLCQSWNTMLICDRSEAQRKAAKGHGLERIVRNCNIADSEARRTPSSSPINSTPSRETPPYNHTGEGVHEVYYEYSKTEHEGESSLFAHAVFASRFLQNVIDSTTNTEIANEMEAVLDGLRAAVYSGKQQSDTLDKLYPRAKAIAPGFSTRSLPLPPLDKVFICLRMARECPQVALLWLGDFIRPAQFSDYLIKVASPGLATEADLIVVHCGLYWLFCECSKVIIDEDTKQDYNLQASICEANLETVISNLRFNQPTNMDLAYAMGMASLYCLQKNKPSAAWKFINSASLTIQALGLQHDVPSGTEGSETKAQKELFWTIYRTEKMLSLRLGRSSTFRDQDITIKRPSTNSPNSSFLGKLAPAWTKMASIQGRIYDEIYSPGALKQLTHIRMSCARGLATELKGVMQQAQDIHDCYPSDKREILGLDYHEIARRSDSVIGFSMLTLIYRSIAPEKPSRSSFSEECIDAARNALQEHGRCVGVIIKAQGKTVMLEAYINWLVIEGSPVSSSTRSELRLRIITHSPFIPFIIIFCHIIETGEASDLELMSGVVETLESTSNSHVQSTCVNQRRLFKSLYDVAAKYVEVRSRAESDEQGRMPWSIGLRQYATATGDTTLNGFGLGTLDSGGMIGSQRTTIGTEASPGQFLPHPEADGDGMGLADKPTVGTALQNTAFGDVDMEIDFSGAQLWDWFNKNQSFMRMLEDA